MPPRYPRLLHDSLSVSAAAYPQKTAVIEGQSSITYEQLQDQALRLASGLRARGVKRGDRVALYMENSLETVVGIYAALYAGAAFMVVNPQTKDDKLEYMLNDAGASALRVQTQQTNLSGVGTAQTGEHLYGGRLAGAVRTDDREYFAALHVEGDILNCHRLPVAFG